MSIALLLPFFSIAAIDSLNPSALLATLFLAQHKKANRLVTAYISGVFSTYLLLGIMIYSGLGGLQQLAGGLDYKPIVFWLQFLLGLGVLLYAIFHKPKSGSSHLRRKLEKIATPPAAFTIGITVTFVEFSTAAPYLVAIGLLAQASLEPLLGVLLLITYNIVFVLPPIVLFLGHKLIDKWWPARYRAWIKKSENGTTTNMVLWIVGIVGLLVMYDAFARLGTYYHWFSTGS